MPKPKDHRTLSIPGRPFLTGRKAWTRAMLRDRDITFVNDGIERIRSEDGKSFRLYPRVGIGDEGSDLLILLWDGDYIHLWELSAEAAWDFVLHIEGRLKVAPDEAVSVGFFCPSVAEDYRHEHRWSFQPQVAKRSAEEMRSRVPKVEAAQKALEALE